MDEWEHVDSYTCRHVHTDTPNGNPPIAMCTFSAAAESLLRPSLSNFVFLILFGTSRNAESADESSRTAAA